MKTIHESFEENYMPYEEPCNNKRGFRIRYAYVAPWYVYRLKKDERQRYKRLFVLLTLLGTGFYLAASLRDCALNYSSFPALFAGLALAAFLFQWIGVLAFAIAKEKITHQGFNQINWILRLAPAANALLLVCAAGSCIIMMVQRRYAFSLLTVPLFYLLAGGCSFLIAFFYRALPFEKQENTTADDRTRAFIRM